MKTQPWGAIASASWSDLPDLSVRTTDKQEKIGRESERPWPGSKKRERGNVSIESDQIEEQETILMEPQESRVLV